MEVSIDTFVTTLLAAVGLLVTILLAVFSFIFGVLWGHHGAIARRVSYEDCNKKRQQCPCFKDIEELKKVKGGKLDETTSQHKP